MTAIQFEGGSFKAAVDAAVKRSDELPKPQPTPHSDEFYSHMRKAGDDANQILRAMRSYERQGSKPRGRKVDFVAAMKRVNENMRAASRSLDKWLK